MDEKDSGLGSLFDDFDQALQGNTSPPARSGKQNKGKGARAYRSALDEAKTDRRQIAKATGKKATIAGQYVRRSFTYRPDQLQDIEKSAKQLGMSQNDLVRWFTDMGIEAIANGKQPPLSEVVRRRYTPNKG